MKCFSRITVLLVALSMSFVLYGESAKENIQNALNQFKAVGNSFVAMKDGFAAMGGVVSDSQIFNFVVFNGATMPVDVRIMKYKNIMGARIKSGVSNEKKIEPGTHSGNTFYKTHLYFALDIPQANFSEGHHEMGIGNDPMVSLYHVYEDNVGIHAELVDSSTSPVGSNEFNAMIYNGSSQLFPLSYTFTPTLTYNELVLTNTEQDTSGISAPVADVKKGKEYTFTIKLEPNVFHTLTSHDTLFFRPSAFTYPNGKLSIPTTGFGIEGVSEVDKDGNPLAAPVYPMRYNYEVLSNGKLVETGLTPGNYKQPISDNIRNITPLEITVWNPSAADLKDSATDYSLHPVADSPVRSMWLLYTGQAYSQETEKMVDNVFVKIPTGKALLLYLIRPTYARKKDVLYVFSVLSSDDEASKRLLSKFITMPVPQPTLAASLNSVDMFSLFKTPLNEMAGMFRLEDFSAQAYIVLQKSFSNFSYDIGPFSYVVRSPLYDKNNIINTFMQCLDSSKSKEDLNTILQTKIPEWVSMFVRDQNETRIKIEEFLVQYGMAELLLTQNSKTTLNSTGKLQAFMLLYGPAGLSKMPLYYQVATEPLADPTNLEPWVDPKNVIRF